MKKAIIVTIKPGMIFARGNDYIKIIIENGKTSYIVHCYNIDKRYTGAMYMTIYEIEKWININGFWFDNSFHGID